MSNVSRSVYQKVCEENKRLKADIKILVEDKLTSKRMLVLNRWRLKFQEEKELNHFLKEHAIQYLKEHPEIKIPTL